MPKKNIKYFKRLGVLASETTENRKTGRMSASYASHGSCPTTCFFLNNGCYTQYGPLAVIAHRLNKQAEGMSPEEIAMNEAIVINQLSGERPLRVHVVGDCKTDDAATIIGTAMIKHEEKHNQPAYTYTHGWPYVKYQSWQGANVLASCETPQQVAHAKERGYPTTLVVGTFQQHTRYTHREIELIPCPAQTRHITCLQCQLCMKVEYLRTHNVSIGFQAHCQGRHGSNAVKLSRKLSQLEK
jgi:hypothetical protein